MDTEFKEPELKTVKEPERKIDYDQEMEFARAFYKKAIEGVEDNPPPYPDTWIKCDTDKSLSNGWESTKVELIGLIEHEETPEDQVKDLKDFLKCSLSVYLDLMSSISSTFLHSKVSTVDEVEEEGDMVGLLE